jgi:lipid-A-disaccharide synthase
VAAHDGASAGVNISGPRIFISVAEDSADVHAASLVRAAATHLPGATFHGLTGPRMRAAGVETVFDLSAHAAMLTGVFSILGKAISAIEAVGRSWRARRPDAVVLIDSPELHLRLAANAKSLGIPVLYYVAPQTWASREYRNRRIARDVDRLACILPFEEAYFRRHGVNATYVGHPLFEALQRESPDPQVVQRLRSGGAPLVAILPGSRRHIIEAMLPLQLEVAQKMWNAGSNFGVGISGVDEDRASTIRTILDNEQSKISKSRRGDQNLEESSGRPKSKISVVVSDNASLLTAADLVLVASGTATLHVAHYRKPMIVMYDAGWLGRLHPLGRNWFIRTPHLSLVNILAGRRIVPEFMPSVRDTAEIARSAGKLLSDDSWRRSMIAQIDACVRPLEESAVSEKVCRLIAELCSRTGRSAVS